MSLVDEAMEKAYIMDKATGPDGYGSVEASYKEGAEIMAAFAYNGSTEARIAAQNGINVRYTVFTKKATVLKFPDVIKRASDGKYFRITSDGNDNRTPTGAGLDLRAVEAEIWEKPANE